MSYYLVLLILNKLSTNMYEDCNKALIKYSIINGFSPHTKPMTIKFQI